MDKKLTTLQDNLEGLWNHMYNLVDDFTSENLIDKLKICL